MLKTHKAHSSQLFSCHATIVDDSIMLAYFALFFQACAVKFGQVCKVVGETVTETQLVGGSFAVISMLVHEKY